LRLDVARFGIIFEDISRHPRAATTGNITLSGDRVLVANEATAVRSQE
jgi:hypothetical protein